jgi:cob(I)alamin adenosyltransferase
MGLPSQPITLSVEQIDELNRKFATMRHDIHNTLSLISAAVELLRCKPHMAERMMATLVEQPAKIAHSLAQFSVEFEQILGIRR